VTGVIMLAFIIILNMPASFGIPPVAVLLLALAIVWRTKRA
jgi:hypothetical protein